MRILFGPDHDGLHVDPEQPGAYEWWYFDALSDDGRWALVVIFFLGTPMSPYYKAVVDGKKPRPMDWCGVFVSLHENVNGHWKERAYAYNLYRHGEFANAPHGVRIGASALTTETLPEAGLAYHVSVREKGLWLGETSVEATFTPAFPRAEHEPLGDDTESHTWVCVAPVCAVHAKIRLQSGKTVAFTGHAYHDHNYGLLPWGDVRRWYWLRCPLQEIAVGDYCAVTGDIIVPNAFRLSKERAKGTLIAYIVEEMVGGSAILMFVGLSGKLSTQVEVIESFHEEDLDKQPYGMRYEDWRRLRIGIRGRAVVHFGSRYTVDGFLVAGPFYQRMSADVAWENPRPGAKSGDDWRGWGIGEVFEPARLCHPLWSRLMWTRIRRRE